MPELTENVGKELFVPYENRIKDLEQENSKLTAELQSKLSQLDGVTNLLNNRHKLIVEYQEKIHKCEENERLIKILSDEVKELRRENEKFRNSIVWLALNAQFPDSMED